MVLMIEKDVPPEPLAHLPSSPGTYVLMLRFSRRLENLVGSLGTLVMQPGFYVYVGAHHPRRYSNTILRVRRLRLWAGRIGEAGRAARQSGKETPLAHRLPDRRSHA